MKKIENNIFLILSIYLKQNFWLRRANDLWLKKKRGIQKKSTQKQITCVKLHLRNLNTYLWYYNSIPVVLCILTQKHCMYDFKVLNGLNCYK